jgi:uncharacterized protein
VFLYLHGFASGPSSTKARAFAAAFAGRGVSLVAPSLDEGDFEHLTLSRQLRLVERLAAGARPLVLIGSSMGGYLAALHASRHPVDALVLMAPAVDFARRWRERLGDEELARWRREGAALVDHHALGRKARLSIDLMDDADRHEPWPAVQAPVLVLQGIRDEVVPLPLVERWVERTPSARLVTYDAGHELIECMDEMTEEARRFLATVPAVVAAHPLLLA